MYLVPAELKEAIPRLRDLLNSKDDFIATSAAKALGVLGPHAQDAAPILLKKLDHPSQDMTFEAGQALVRVDPKGSIVSSTHIPTLVDALGHRSGTMRVWSAEALLKIGPAAAPNLITALRKHDNHYVRDAAAWVLGDIGLSNDDVVQVLTEALDDENSGVRESAARSVGRIGPNAQAAIPSLIRTLKDEDLFVSLWAIKALGAMGSEAKDAVPELIEILKSSKPGVTGRIPLHATIRTSGKLRERIAAPALEATSALGRIGSPAIPNLIQLLKYEKRIEVWKLALDALDYIGPEATKAGVQLLIEALRHGDNEIRRHAIHFLSTSGKHAHAAVPALIDALRDRDKSVRYGAAFALGKIGLASKEVLTALTAVLEDEHEDVRQVAAIALTLLSGK